MPHLLSAAAAANASHVRDEAERQVAVRPSWLTGFRTLASTSSAGTAVLAFKLDLFDREAGVLSGRAIVAAVQGLKDADDVETAFAETQQNWYAPRLAFEDHWQNGRQFIYTALILKGLAPPHYGPYTLIVNDPPRCQGCFPGNTAARYAGNGTLNVTLCESEVAPWSGRGDLLTAKHGSRVPDDRRSWPTLVLSDTDFSEALWVSPIGLALVSEVRVDNTEYRRWRQLRRDFLNGADLDDADLRDVKALDLLESWRSQHRTRIVAV